MTAKVTIFRNFWKIKNEISSKKNYKINNQSHQFTKNLNLYDHKMILHKS